AAAAAALQLVDELVEAAARRAAGRDGGVQRGPHLAHLLPEHLPFLPAHHPLDPRPHLAGVHGAAVADGHAGAPLPHDEAAVGELVGEQREAQHRHPGPRALQDGVPAAVREEGGDGGVGEHLHLAAPRHHHAAAVGGGGGGEAVGERVGVVGADDVRPHHPQEPGAAGEHAAGDLVELAARDVGVAAEGDVEHGARRLRGEPPGAVGLGPHGGGDGAAGEAGGEDGADGVERPLAAERGDGGRLQLLHRVAHHVVGAAGLLERPEDDAVHHRGRVRVLQVRHQLPRLDRLHPRHVRDRVLPRLC
ncbi:Os10g0442466, partial [Oryza sativa Japonica Group]